MKVRLKHDISGTRNGQPWPPAGAEIDLSDNEAARLLRTGAATPVNAKDADVEVRATVLDKGTEQRVKHDTRTRERKSVSKRAHEPTNAGVADDNQPAEGENGPRLPEVNAQVSAKVEDPAKPGPNVEDPAKPGPNVEQKPGGDKK